MAWVTGTAAGSNDYLLNIKNASEANGWTTLRYDTTVSTAHELILVSSIGVYVGFRTYTDSSTYYNMEVAGMTGYSAGLLFSQQPNISPGRHESGNGGQFVPLGTAPTTSLAFKLSVRDRRIIGVASSGGNDSSFHVGLLNPYSTASENSYPMYVGGSTSNETLVITSSGNTDFSCYMNPSDSSGGGNTEQGVYRDAAGNWHGVKNSSTTGSPILAGVVIYPCATAAPQGTGADDIIGSANLRWGWASGSLIPPIGDSTPSRDFILKDTPDSTAINGAQKILVPCVMAQIDDTQGNYGAIGEIDGTYWVNNGVVSGDTYTIGLDTYSVFKMGNRTDDWAYFAVKQQ